MDFSTMSSKINCHCYDSFESFLGDFELMISNCLLYNGPGSELHCYATKVHKKVSKQAGQAAYLRFFIRELTNAEHNVERTCQE